MSAGLEEFWARMAGAWRNGSLLRVTLGGPRARAGSLRQVIARPVQLREGPRLSMVWREARRDVTRNLPFAEGESLLRELLGVEFVSGWVHSRSASWTIELRPGRPAALKELPPALTSAEAPPERAEEAASLAAGEAPEFPPHDRPKARALPHDRPWLKALGVVGDHGRVRVGMEAKFRQIHRFVELLEPLLRGAPLPSDGVVRLIDMGCGKGYLTFAAFELLQRLHPGRPVEALGVEARPELAAEAEAVARDGGHEGLSFRAGAIRDAPYEGADVVVALHACDTATDDALAWAVRRKAALIVASPCCHQELRPQMTGPAPWAFAFRQGLLLERQAEWLTDALRAMFLEWAGYEARAFEFISPEHTGKNLMLTGSLRRGDRPSAHEAARAARALAAEFGVRRQTLATQLGFPWTAAPGVPLAE